MALDTRGYCRYGVTGWKQLEAVEEGAMTIHMMVVRHRGVDGSKLALGSAWELGTCTGAWLASWAPYYAWTGARRTRPEVAQ